jgi:hypothetical protein
MDEISGQGVLETVGAAGLSPGVPSSVEPSGTAPLADPGVEPVAPVADVAAPDEPDAPEVQPVAIVGVDIVPPPSKLELDPTVVAAPEQGVVLAVGLKPPESSSVAPSGIPPGIDGWSESDEPSGDVAPIPGVTITCAKPTSQCAKINRAAPAVVRTRHIEASALFVAARLGLSAISPIDRPFSTRLRRPYVKLRW